MENLDNKARTIQEIANGVGWDIDIQLLIDRVKVLDKGLVQEDEFIYVINWCRKCTLIHKLDQLQLPASSKTDYTIPDILVEVEVEGMKKSYLIEIKTSEDNKLSWTNTYYNGLLNYSRLTGIPVLVAWKWNALDIWTVFDINSFSKAEGHTNYKISLEKALKENLMSQIFGDYLIAPYKEFGFHMKFKKVAKHSETTDVDGTKNTTWNAITTAAYLTGKDGEVVTTVDEGFLALLLLLPLEEETIELEEEIIRSYCCKKEESVFAQKIPVALTLGFSDSDVNWLLKSKEDSYPIEYEKLKSTLTKGIDMNLIHIIILQQPLTPIK